MRERGGARKKEILRKREKEGDQERKGGDAKDKKKEGGGGFESKIKGKKTANLERRKLVEKWKQRKENRNDKKRRIRILLRKVDNKERKRQIRRKIT